MSALQQRFPAFREFAEDVLRLRVRRLEFAAKSLATKRKRGRALAWGGALALAVWMAQGRAELWQILIWFVGTALVAGLLFDRLARSMIDQSFIREFHAEMLGEICRFLNFGFEQNPTDFHLYGYEQLGLVPSHADYNVQNRIYGQLEGLEFEAAQLSLKERLLVPGQRHEALLLRMPALSRFEGRTVILQRDENLADTEGRFEGFSRIQSSNAQFAKYFETLGTDGEEVKYLLPDEAVVALVALRRKPGVRSVAGAFVNGNFLLAVELESPLFGGKEMFTATSADQLIGEYERGVADLLAIVDSLRPVAGRPGFGSGVHGG